MYQFPLYHTSKFTHCKSRRWTLSSVKLKGDAFIIKNRNFWFCSYWEIDNNNFHHGQFLFFLCCYFEPCCTYLNLSIFLAARFKRCYEPRGAVQTSQHVSNGVWNVLYIQLQGWTSLCSFEPREQTFFKWFLSRCWRQLGLQVPTKSGIFGDFWCAFFRFCCQACSTWLQEGPQTSQNTLQTPIFSVFLRFVALTFDTFSDTLSSKCARPFFW